MELKARIVLDDCYHAWQLLQEETNPNYFRVHWVAAIALLRAVGHVLEKVDAPKTAIASVAIAKAYSRWKSDIEGNAVFWEFIKEERDNVLKEYVVGFSSDPVNVVLGGKSYLIDDLLFCSILDGRFAGQDCRDVLDQAIDWWEKELDAIAEEIIASGNDPRPII